MTIRLPAWKASPFGNKRYWTQGRVLEALRAAAAEIVGPLPCGDAAYTHLKKGRMDWPPASRVLEYFHAMARAWLAAGADPGRVSFKNLDWTDEEVCGGAGYIVTCWDDLCQATGECRHGDGESACPECGGSGEVFTTEGDDE